MVVLIESMHSNALIAADHQQIEPVSVYSDQPMIATKIEARYVARL